MFQSYVVFLEYVNDWLFNFSLSWDSIPKIFISIADLHTLVWLTCYFSLQNLYWTKKGQEVKKFLPSKEALRCQTYDPCHYQKKHFGNIIEHNDVGVDHLTAKISFEILLTVCHTIFILLVWRIWYWIN